MRLSIKNQIVKVMLILRDGIVVTMEGADIAPFKGSVVLSGERIELVTQCSERIEDIIAKNPNARVIDCCGKVIMPGLINTHCHVSMTLQRGLADDIELVEWLNDWVWPFEAKQSDDDIEAGARLGIAEMLLGGVTSFVDMYFSEHRVARAAEDLGIRATLAECILDVKSGEFETNLAKVAEIAARTLRIKAAVAPHAPYTCSRESLDRCKSAAADDMTLTVHLLESPSERDMVQSREGCDPMEHLLRSDIVNEKSLLVHCVQLSDNDIDIIKERGASVSHNAQSNMKISSGVAPIAKLVERGVNVTLGTDGACSNNDLDMWEEMRCAALLQRVVTMNPLVLPAYKVLEMATCNAAKALGMEGELGVIREGALADIIVIDMNKAHLKPLHNVISTLLYCVKAADVEMTIVGGEIIVEGGRLQGVDIEALMEDVTQRAKRIITQRG